MIEDEGKEMGVSSFGYKEESLERLRVIEEKEAGANDNICSRFCLPSSSLYPQAVARGDDMLLRD